jgi:subtilisin family serine protease
MNYKSIFRGFLARCTIGIAILLLCAMLIPSCRPKTYRSNTGPTQGPTHVDTVVWGDYNIVFQPTSTPASRDSIINVFQTAVCDTFKKYNPGFNCSLIHFDYQSCPCGPLLLNVKVVIGTVGGSVTNTPPTNPPPGPAGGSVIQNIALNIKITVPELSQNFTIDSGIAQTYFPPVPKDKVGKTIIALIDTGIDTLIYNNKNPGLSNWIWQDPAGNSIYNFIGGNTTDFRDRNPERHGTLVTAMALDAFANSQVYPRLMILKALDDSGHGTIFSVSCAIGYAICHQATLINASWGYYGAPDPTLQQYITLSNTSGIPFIAAAGNTPPPHSQSFCQASLNPAGNLNNNTPFYPACFVSNNLPDLISVANMRLGSNNSAAAQDSACYYQNYSPTYVSTGVVNTNSTQCCQYDLPYGVPTNGAPTNVTAEGSSFATPVVTGQIASFLESGGKLISGTIWLRNNCVQSAPGANQACCTINGQYLFYKGTF